ncbi:2'-5' RNA ligase family protein [Flavobacterium reichenbachii]|uniref:2'-5' RNA ligase n=1 Tax=Flavobacterium reichenbachii TaxID=362418 RepID=A0A085ZG05_9FLAO|nr:2'-5' RNA ligase family protein [Flavobacterium reichenbachii]KFF03369.1 2'-5' RNA ligase [Flavobacterium reichenbachii]OXB16734.1 2'-5' RNA ligase [Flavobacterium reichenbachii]
MEKKFSVAVYPSQEVMDSVKTMKDYLKSKIDWYNSCNSTAHITICEFTIDESQINQYKEKLFKTADTFTPFSVHLDHFGSYENAGAFFIAPNEESKNKLKPIMKKIQETLKSLKLKKSDDPHMSIGRKLIPENLKIAAQLFTTIEIDFLCKEIVLRELDPVKKQFFVIDTFSFNGNTQPEFVQGSLF